MDKEPSRLYTAIIRKDKDLIELLVTLNQSLDLIETLLLFSQEKPEFFPYMRLAGVNFNCKDDLGNTPILRALQQQKYSLAEKLAENHANIYIANNEGISPYILHLKSEKYSEELTWVLKTDNSNIPAVNIESQQKTFTLR